MASAADRGAFRGNFAFTTGDLFRVGGRYGTFQKEARIANKRLAANLQKTVARALRQGLVRPRVSSGLLERVTLDSRNAIADQEGFGVGVIDFLDNSEAKYWLQIEEGSDVHLGQRLVGVWATRTKTLGLSGLASERFSGSAPRGQVTAFGEGTGQAFFAMGARQARQMLARQKIPSNQRRISGEIKKPMPKEAYYKRGWQEFDPITQIEREYNDIFRRVGFKVVWTRGPGGVKALTKVPLRGSPAAGRRQARDNTP
jgi:hypothetical protein